VPLIAALGDDHEAVREQAARALGCDEHSALGCDSEEAVAPLIELLEDDDEFVRLEAVRTLSDIRAPEAARALGERAREDTMPAVRRDATRALGHLRDNAGRDALVALEAGDDEATRDAARRALQEIDIRGGIMPDYVRESALVPDGEHEGSGDAGMLRDADALTDGDGGAESRVGEGTPGLS